MRVLQANDIKKEIIDLYDNGIDGGVDVGFRCLRDLYKVKLGCTTYYTGTPTSGKTEFMFEILINLSEFYGWKHLIHTPETGSPKQIIAELAHKYIGKNFKQGYDTRMDEQELYNAINWIDEHFIIMDAEDVGGCDLEQFLKQIDSIAVNHKFHTVTIDPWDELEHNMNGLREDEYLKKYLSYIRRYARKNHIHFNIVAHPKTPQKDAKGGYLPATAYDISGGSKWYNKAESIICLHRPLNTKHGEPNINTVNVMIQKAKPKEIGKKGEVELNFDLKRNRYYEWNVTGGTMYACKDLSANLVKQEAIKPNEDFDEGVPF